MTDKNTPPKITPVPEESKYDAPSKGLLRDLLEAAGNTVAFNDKVAEGRRETEDRKQALRDKLQERCAADKQELLARFEKNVKPLLDALEALPAQAGRKFTVEIRLSDEDVEHAAAALDETKYRGPRLHASLRYTGGAVPGATRHASGVTEQPALDIEIGPHRILPNETIRVTRFDVVEPSFFDQGGAGPDDYASRDVYSYTDLRREIGKWLGNVAPERVADIAEAAKPKLPPGKRGPKL